jgi:hypothetical protein
MAYTGIAKGAKFTAANMEAALDTKMSAGDEETPDTEEELINGKKTFVDKSPEVPSKSTAAGNNSMAIATEAQVYKGVYDSLSSMLSLSDDEDIDGTKKFAISPEVRSKGAAITEADPAAIATEAQVYKTLMCW